MKYVVNNRNLIHNLVLILLNLFIIKEKRKQEEQESELNKKVKTEGDASESLIKDLVKEVESEMADIQNDVNFLKKFY